MIKVKGILTNPFGVALPKVKIRITPTTSGSHTIAFLSGLVITGLDGSYDFDIKKGKFLIEMNQTGKEYSDAAIIDVIDESGEYTLEGLLFRYLACNIEFPPCSQAE